MGLFDLLIAHTAICSIKYKSAASWENKGQGSGNYFALRSFYKKIFYFSFDWFCPEQSFTSCVLIFSCLFEGLTNEKCKNAAN